MSGTVKMSKDGLVVGLIMFRLSITVTADWALQNLPTYLPTYLLTYLHTYLPTHLPTYLPTYVLTCLAVK